MSAKLKNVMLRKPAGVSKILHDVKISRHEVNNMSRHFLYDDDINLRLKLGSDTFYWTKVIRKYIV